MASRSESCPTPITTADKIDRSEYDVDDLKKLVYRENDFSISVEDPEFYSGTRGYMPIEDGSILSNYKTIRKLGFGQFSTVWLGEDIREENKNRKKYVALKISKGGYDNRKYAHEETKILLETKQKNPELVGYNNVIQLIDYFTTYHFNIAHDCIALEVMGPSLFCLLKKSYFQGIQVAGVRRIIKQVLQGLMFLHKECRLIHTDIKPENILVKVNEAYIMNMVKTVEKMHESGIPLPKTYVSSTYFHHDEQQELEEYTFDELYSETYHNYQTKSYPQDTTLFDILHNYREKEKSKVRGPMWVNENIEVKIGDLGNAAYIDNRYHSVIQTRQYRALEVILDAGYNTPADLWSVGCMAFELATGEFLIDPKNFRNIDINTHHLMLIWEVIGGIPEYIINSGRNAPKYFLNGYLKNISDEDLHIWRVEDVLVQKYKWKRVDAIPFAGFIESLIEPDPSLRASAESALASTWINE